MKFHHLGLLTKSIETTQKTLVNLGYNLVNSATDYIQEVKLEIFNFHDNTHMIELVEPLPTNEKLTALLNNRGENIYHICYSVNSINDTIKQLQNDCGFLLLSPSKPAILFKNRYVAFGFCKGMGLIELLEAPV